MLTPFHRAARVQLHSHLLSCCMGISRVWLCTVLKQNELQSSEKVREDLALSFNEMKRELLRLNKQYEKM